MFILKHIFFLKSSVLYYLIIHLEHNINNIIVSNMEEPTEIIANQDQILEYLLIIQLQASINQPACHHRFEIDDITLPETKDQVKTILDSAFAEFKEAAPIKGPVHIGHNQWAIIFFEFVEKAVKTNQQFADVPNGCCNKENCPIKIYYEILYEHILNE
jgi:hypothetical protein